MITTHTTIKATLITLMMILIQLIQVVGFIPSPNTPLQPLRHAFTKPNIDQHFKPFSDSFNGTLVIIESIKTSSCTGFWHVLKCVKFFVIIFSESIILNLMNTIELKITFDSIFHANKCLESLLLLLY